jgi:hypothetical protein
MRTYIQAAYDPSMPNWLNAKNDYSESALDSLRGRYALNTAKFYDTPQPDSIPIHLLYDVYVEVPDRWNDTARYPTDEYVYIPGETGYNAFIKSETSETYRRVSTSSKAKIAPHIADTVYMVATPRNEYRADRKYIDPRYEKNYNGKWNYGGQVFQYGYWAESYNRDKSGYAIPNPTELYEKLYNRFPNRIQSKLDKVTQTMEDYYNKLEEAKTLVFNQFDIRNGTAPYFGSSYYNSPIYRLGEAIRNYGRMYSAFKRCLNQDGSVDSQKLAEFMNGNNYESLSYSCQSIDSDLEKIHKALS